MDYNTEMSEKSKTLLNLVIKNVKVNEAFDIQHVIKIALNYGKTGIIVAKLEDYSKYAKDYMQFLYEGDFINDKNGKQVLTENGKKVKKLGSFEKYYEWQQKEADREERIKELDFKNKLIIRRTWWVSILISVLSLTLSFIIWIDKKKTENNFNKKFQELEQRIDSIQRTTK